MAGRPSLASKRPISAIAADSSQADASASSTYCVCIGMCRRVCGWGRMCSGSNRCSSIEGLVESASARRRRWLRRQRPSRGQAMITPQAGNQYADHKAGLAAAARIATAAMRFAQTCASQPPSGVLPFKHALDDDARRVKAVGVIQRVSASMRRGESDASRLRARSGVSRSNRRSHSAAATALGLRATTRRPLHRR